MFERELERARKGLRDLIMTRDPYVTLQSILTNGAVHPAYRTFFGAEVSWWVHEERAIRSSNPRFETSEPVFKELFAKLDDALMRHARFDHEELSSTVDAAVKTRLNFLCRPRTTLKWFVFRGEPTKPLNEVLLRLAYLHDHEYLTDGIRHWAEARRADSISSYEILSIVEFERIIEKIDNDAILDLSQDEFVELLAPLYEWFAEHNPELPPESIPTEAVIIFLDDKGAIPISQTLERMLYRENLKLLTRTKFFDVIDFVISEIESGAIPGPASNTEPSVILSEAKDPTSNTEPSVILSEAKDPTSDTEPSVILSEAKDPEPEPEPSVILSEAKDPEPEPLGTLYEQRYQRFSEATDASTRQRYLKRLFDQEEIEMETVLGDVLGSETWKIAAAKLDRWFIRRGIEPNNAIAMELTHALNRAFR